MTTLSLLRRVSASAALIAAAVAFLVEFGPGARPAHADIYAPLMRAAGFLAPPGGRDGTVTGTVLVNGQTFRYTTGHSRWSLDRVLDNYELQLRVTTKDGRVLKPAARFANRDAGIVSGFQFDPNQDLSDLSSRLQNFLKTTKVSELGGFHMVLAFAGDDTTFVEFTAGEDVALKTLVPHDDSDAGGEDLQGVARPAALQRYVTIDHGEGPAASRTLLYRSRDGRAHIDEFRAAFRAAGWTANPAMDSGAVAHFTDGAREALVGGVQTDSESGVVVVFRNNLP